MTTKKLENGGYEIRGDYEDPRTGKRRQVRRRFKTLREAREFERELLTGEAASRRGVPTFGEYAQAWLEAKRRRNKIAPNTYSSYRWALGKATELLGSRRLDAITVTQIEAALDEIEQATSAYTASKVLITMRFMYKSAVRDGLVKSSPASLAEATRAKTAKVKTPDAQDLANILRAAEGDIYAYTFLLTLAATGCRKGELYGLLWDCVDLDAGRLEIRRTRLILTKAAQAQYGSVAGEPVPGLPVTHALSPQTKTKQERFVTIPRNVADLLRVLRKQQMQDRMLLGPDYIMSDYVFTTDTGKPLEDFNTAHYRRGFSLHSFRHAHATILLDEGVPLVAVSKRLGHSSIQVTSDTYTDLLKKQDDAASDVFSAALDTKMTHSAHTDKAK